MKLRKWFKLTVFEDPAVDRTITVFFLQGVACRAKNVWAGPADAMWCEWLVKAVPGARVVVVDYKAPRFALLGGGRLSIEDYAKRLTEELTANGYTEGRCAIVAHSLGGLIAKSMLKFSTLAKNARHRQLADALEGIFFIATPHNGSQLASVAQHFPGATKILKELAGSAATVQSLAEFYSARAQHYGIRTRAFVERRPTNGVIVVSEDSADPKTADCDPIPLDRSHMGIARVADEADGVFPGIVQDLKRWVATPRKETPGLSPDELGELADVLASEGTKTDRLEQMATVMRAAAARLQIRHFALAPDTTKLARITVATFEDARALGLVDLAAIYPDQIDFRTMRHAALA
jgi:predicted alpha/beta hydrolase family esterase